MPRLRDPRAVPVPLPLDALMLSLHLQIGEGCPGCTVQAGELTVDVETVIRAAGFAPTPFLVKLALEALKDHVRIRHPRAMIVEEEIDDEHPPTF